MVLFGIYGVPRVDRDVSVTCGDSLCAFMSGTSESPKGDGFNAWCVRARIESKSAEHRSFSLRRRDLKCQPSRNGFTSLRRTCERSSRPSILKASKDWSPSTAVDGPRSSTKNNIASSSKQHSAPPIFWDNLSRAGRCLSCATSSFTSGSWNRSALRPFDKCSSVPRSNCVARRPGKSATIPICGLKKSNPALRKPTCGQRADDFIRRVWPLGSSPSAWAELAPNAKPRSTPGHLHPETWRSSLVGLLRCSRRQVVGIYAEQEAVARGARRVETHAPTVSTRATHSSDPGQFLTTRNPRSQAMVSTAQHPFDLDANKCVLAKPNRMSVHAGQGIRHSQLELRRPWRDQPGVKMLCRLQKPLCETEVIGRCWKRH